MIPLTGEWWLWDKWEAVPAEVEASGAKEGPSWLIDRLCQRLSFLMKILNKKMICNANF